MIKTHYLVLYLFREKKIKKVHTLLKGHSLTPSRFYISLEALSFSIAVQSIKMAAFNVNADGPTYETMYDSIDDLIGKSNGKNADEIKVLKSTIENLCLKNKLEIAAKENEIEAKDIQIKERENQIKAKELQIQAKDIEIKERDNQIRAKEIQIQTKHFQEIVNQLKAKDIKIQDFHLQIQTKKDEIKEKESQLQAKDIQIEEKDNQIQAKENQILELENENKLLKMKTNVEKKATPFINETYIDPIDQEWFDMTRIRLTKNTPYIFEKCLLVKVTCKSPTNAYYFNSSKKNNFFENQTQLNIFNKGWRHESTTVSIVHPIHDKKFLTMKECLKGNDFHQWKVDYVSNDYIDEDGYFIVVCSKK